MTISLESCWAKMHRAKVHRDRLDHDIRETFSVTMNRPRLGIKFEADTGQHVLYVSSVPDLAPVLTRVALCFGDIMHNFRSALDHLTYQLALWNTGGQVSRPKRVQFPIVDDPRYFKSATGDALSDVRPEHQAIIERFQPYHRIVQGRSIGPPFHPFALLRDLDNADKYRLLRPAMIPPTSARAYRGDALMILTQGVPQTPDWTLKLTPITPGSELIRATLPAHVTLPTTAMAGSIRPDLGLPEGWPIHYVIDRVAGLILKVIGEFQPLL